MKKTTEHTVTRTEHVRWECELHYDETFTADPCPYCENEDVFTVCYSMTTQYAQTADEDEQGELAADDVHVGSPRFVRCDECHEVLLDDDGIDGPKSWVVGKPKSYFDTDWVEVRRSTPAEHVDRIPDDAIDWAVWTTNDLSITVYKQEQADGSVAYYVVGSVDSHDELLKVFTAEDSALEYACEQRRTLEFVEEIQ